MSVIETKDDTKSFDKTTGFTPGAAGTQTRKGCSLGALEFCLHPQGSFRRRSCRGVIGHLGNRMKTPRKDMGRKNGEARHNEIGAPASGIKVRLANKS
jgi:hypothetical protein